MHPRTWYTIEYFNENLLVRVKNKMLNTETDYKIKLDNQNYTLQTLRDQFEFKLTESIPQLSWTVLSFPTNGRITISTDTVGAEFWILSDLDVSNNGTAKVNTLGIDPSNPQTCNSVLGNMGHGFFPLYGSAVLWM